MATSRARIQRVRRWRRVSVKLPISTTDRATSTVVPAQVAWPRLLPRSTAPQNKNKGWCSKYSVNV